MSLRQTATRGMLWSTAERFGEQGVLFAVQIVLARLLAPEQFGLIAMLTIFLAISAAIVDAGFGQAIIQRKHITSRDLNTVFIFNLVMSILMAGLLWTCSPWVARFYDQPPLVAILRWLALGLIIGSISSVQRAVLQKEMRFDLIFRVSVPSVLLGGITGITLAWVGFGVWALVAQSLVLTTLRSILFWVKSSWHPKLEFSSKSFASLFPYGWKMALSGILNQGFANAYMLVIGKFFSAQELGYYHRARSFQTLPMNNLTGVIGSVAFPMLSGMQGDRARLRGALHKLIPVSAFVAFPIMSVMAAVAEPMVVTLVGEKWLPCVPFLQVMCVMGAFLPIHSVNLTVLQATGRSDLFLGLEVLKKILTVGNIMITYRFGIMAMIWGGAATSFVALVLNSLYTRKLAGYSLANQLRDILPVLILSVAIYFIVSHLVLLLLVPAPFQLVAGAITGLLMVLISVRFLGENLRTELAHLAGRLPAPLQSLACRVLKSEGCT